ncbi:hypothetical protein FG379_003520 [Cryptosporidium bovis]|uniref:uncharacterized protein n=1 Tax=Cryptosporidium bovis TaxID=310047 RepID=UPI00351A53F1|nr:hypothetical protein FG379_003520 [Cryptosporidium bovis]
METSSRGVKFPEDKYIRYGQRIGFRACNSSYEYMTLMKYKYYDESCYKVILTNIHPFTKQDSGIYRDSVEENDGTFIESGWYLMNICNIMNQSKNNEGEYLQSGDVVFLCTYVDSDFLILGYDLENCTLRISNIDELLKINLNGLEVNSVKRYLKNHEWVIEKVPISKEESIAEKVSSLPAPNINSMRFSDIFLIRPSTSDDVIFSKELVQGNNTYINSLSLGKIAIAGRNGYWTILPSSNSEFPLPSWYKLRNVLRRKKSEKKYSFNSINKSFINIDSVKNSKLNELAAGHFSNLKIPRFEVEMLNLISDQPIGWDNLNSNFTDIYTGNDNEDLSTTNFEVSPSFGGYLFDHAKRFCVSLIKENNLSLMPLDRYPSKIQEQLLLEDILCCLLCTEGNYIKVVEQINVIEKKNYDFSETLFLIQNTENNSLNVKRENISFSVLEGLSTFSHYINNDPNKMNSADVLENTQLSGEFQPLSKFNTSVELECCDSSKVNNNDPVILPLTYRILELSSLNRRIRQFLYKHEDGNNFGLISNALCETFRELLKHFEIKIHRFEALIRKGTLSLQNFWSQSQQALTTLKAMDLIATNVLYRKGCEIINAIFDLIQKRFRGESSNINVANFILSQLLVTWIKHFLIPWTKYGKVNDNFLEFGHFGCKDVDELVNKETVFSKFFLFERVEKEGYFLDLRFFPKCLEPIFKEVNYIGNVSKLISKFQDKTDTKECTRCVDSLYLQMDFERIMQLLDLNSNVIKFDAFFEHFRSLYNEFKVKLYRFCCEQINLNNCLKILKDIFLCSNDLFIQEFIDYIGLYSLGGNLSGNCCNNYISHKWNILANKYYKKNIDCCEDFEFYCTFDEKLVTEKILGSFSKNKWNIDDSLKGIDKNLVKTALNFEAFKHLTVKLHTKNHIIRAIWTEDILEKYQVLFRFIFHLKYIQKLLTDTWFTQKATPLWGYTSKSLKINKGKINKSSIYPRMGRSYLLRHKMLSIINSILEYITYDVVESSWNEFIKGLENVKTMEEVVYLQNQTVEEMMTLCFCSKYGSFCSLFKMISICHLFARYSALFNVYSENKLGKFNNSPNFYNEMQSTSCASNLIENEKNITIQRGRFGINTPHIELLLADSSFEDIIEKLDSKFSLFFNDFVVSSQKDKHPKQHTLNKIFEKLSFNSY